MRGARKAAVVIVLAAFLAACGGGKPANRNAAHCPAPKGVVSVGESIPAACTLERMQGGVLRLADLKGKPAVINFWATWCTFCIEEMPAIEKATVGLRDKVAIIGADLLGVDGETRQQAERFARRTGVTYQLVYDEDGVLFGNFSAQLLLPVTIFVGADGIVAHRQFGPMTEKRLRGLLSATLDVR